MPYCLIKKLADDFRRALKDGTIDPTKLAELSSAERRAFFEKIIGKDNSVKVNELFESKLLLKNTEQGMINWAKQVTGIKPEVRSDLISRIQKMKPEILDPVNEKAFLEDLAAKRLGTEVTFEEAKQITELSRNLAKAKENISSDRLTYAATQVQLENYLNDLKIENSKLKLADFRADPAGSAVKVVSDTAGLAKSLKASLDVSALGRQGFKAIFTHPRQWADGAVKTFGDTWGQLRAKASDNSIYDGIRAEIISRDNALDGTYKRMKLDIGSGEEAFPTSLPERIPAIGRVFKSSEVAYKGFLTRLRADIADKYIEIAKNNGVDLKDAEQAQAIGRLVNSLTGRGSLGRFEQAGKTVNTLFFSPKSVKANFDFLTAHTFEKTTPFARKQAAINLAKVAGGVATILAIAKALYPDSVDEDPRSADSGKIRIGDTRFDVSGGMSSLVTLASRLLTSSTKSSVSDAVKPLGTGFGQTSARDVISQFAENKLSPASSFIWSLFKRTDFKGEPITPQGMLKDLLVPLPVSNAQEVIKNPNSAPLLLALIADGLGIATNTYPSANIKSKIIPENKKISDKSLIEDIITYAEAIGTDPETAFNRIFTGQYIRRVDNGAVIVERMPLKDSTAIKKKGKANNPTMKLDHTIPLELGGSNSEDNLKLVTTAEWSSYTRVENYLADLLQAKKISKQEAQDLVKKFKKKEIKAEKIFEIK